MVDYAEDAPSDLRVRLWIDGALVDGNGRDDESIRKMRECWDDLLCDDSWNSATRADESFEQYAASQQLPPATVRAMDAYMAVEYATCLSDLGLKEWRRREHFFEEADCSTDYHMEGRYGAALAALAGRATAAGATLHLNRPVEIVDATQSSSSVVIDGAESFDCAVVTSPLPLIASGKVRLVGVREGLVKLAGKVRSHGAGKIMISLSHKCWGGGGRRVAASASAASRAEAAVERRTRSAVADDEHGSASSERWGELLLCAEEASFAKQIWLREATNERGEPVYIAAGFLAGPRDAALCESLSTEEACEALLVQLRQVYGYGEELVAKESLKVDWGTDEWAGGAYSSPTLDCVDAWRELRDTGCERLLLAGEAIGERGSTVCSALASAEWAAQELIDRFGGSE